MNTKKFLQIDKLNSHAYDVVFNDPDLGINLSREAFDKSVSQKYNRGIAESKLQEGWCLLIKSSYEESLIALEESLNEFINIHDYDGEMKALNAFGVLYSNISNYETAMDYYTRVLELNIKTNNDERRVAAYINIGTLYAELGKQEESLNFYNQAIIILKKTNNQEQLCVCMINIGDIYENRGNFDDALIKYREGLSIAESINNKIYVCNSLTSLGKTYQNIGKYHKAEDSHLQSRKIAEVLGDKLSKTECLTNLGTLYLAKDDADRSIKYHTEALELSKGINSKYYESKNYLSISNCYESKNMPQDALSNFRKYHNLKIELQNEEIDIKLKNINTQNKIEAAKREAKVQRNKNKELQEAFDRVSILNKVGQDITSSLDLETVMTTIYENISTFISTDLFGIALYDKDSEEIDFKYFILDGKRKKGNRKSVHTEGSLAGWVITNGESLFINDIQNEYLKYVPKLIGSNSDKTRSVIFVPLKTANNITGIITVQSNTLNAYALQDLDIIQAVGAYSAIAIENSTVHEEISKLNKIINSEKKALEKAYMKIDRLANHDTLTGLPNRRLFIELLKQELRQADRQKTKTAILFIDLDNFKLVNDSLGHDAGDKVLQMVAQRFISTLRESDAIARVGGDEFAAIICNIKNKTDIKKIAQKLINKFKNPFKIENSEFHIGLSVGISIYPDDDNTIDGLIKKADTAMYKIKSENKNSFIFFKE